MKFPTILTIAIFAAGIITIYGEAPIKLHILPSSHNDLGWIYTVGQYYQGTNTHDGGCIKCILNNIYDILMKNSKRIYTMAEVGFFKLWWDDQSPERKEQFKKYVKMGQFKFINGAWVTNDEACSYYEDIIDQFILGHRWLQREFGVTPTTGWQVDPFGHSRGHGSLMALMGIQGHFIGARIDYTDHGNRKKARTLEFNWATDNPRGESTFSHILFLGYTDARYVVPNGAWCRTLFCNGNLNENQKQKTANFVKENAAAYRTRNIALLVCDDFYLFKEQDYVGIEDLIKYFDDHPNLGIQAKMSDPEQYTKEVFQDWPIEHKNEKFPVEKADFFPYVESPGTSWTGYFTSKAPFKAMVRNFSKFYNAAKLMFSKFLLRGSVGKLTLDQGRHADLNKALNGIEEPLAVAQHHDAITGTMKEFVRRDYERMLHDGRAALNRQTADIWANYLNDKFQDNFKWFEASYDWSYSDSAFDNLFHSGSIVNLHVYNPGDKDEFLIKVKVGKAETLSVLDQSNKELQSDLVCNSNDAASDCYLYFKDVVPGYSEKTYKINRSSGSNKVEPIKIDKDYDLLIENQVLLKINKDLSSFNYRVCSDESAHNILGQETPKGCLDDTLSIGYYYYESTWGSGAYVFKARDNNKKAYGSVKSARIFKGNLITILQIFNNLVRTDIKFIHNNLDGGMQIDTFMEPVQKNGEEIVLAVKSNSVKNNDNSFYTDSNGYIMEYRKKGWRMDFQTNDPNAISYNFYPVNAAIYIEGGDKRLTLSNDRPQGGTSYNVGEVELMIHRVCSGDDWKGVGEVLNEYEGNSRVRVRTRHWLHLSSPSNGFKHLQREIQYKNDRELQHWFFTTSSSTFNKQNYVEGDLNLGKNTKLYVRTYSPNEYILRFHNMDDTENHVTLYDHKTNEVTILNTLAGKRAHTVKEIEELILTTTKPHSELMKNSLDPDWPKFEPKDGPNHSTIQLLPNEMRTFKIVVA